MGTVDFAELFAGLPTAYLVMTPDLVIVEANNAYLQLLDRAREDLVGRPVFEAFPPAPGALDEDGHNALQVSFERARDTRQVDVMPLYKYDVLDPRSGKVVERYWSLISAPLLGQDGETRLILQRVEDVTDWVREREGQHIGVVGGGDWRRRLEVAEEDLYKRVQELKTAQEAQERAVGQLRASEQRSRAILDSTTDAIITINAADVMESVNRAAEAMFGFPASELVGCNISTLIPAIQRWQHDGSWACYASHGAVVDAGLELAGLRADRSTFPVELTLTEVGSDPPLFTAVVRDITRRKQLEAELTDQALRDPLTGLANRTLLVERLDHALALRARHPGVLALFFIDLDRFKLVNDTLGHEAGDELLVLTANRVRQAVRPEDLVARLGGDEFVVLCEDLHDASEAESIARRVVERLNRPLYLRQREIYVSASVGVVTDTGERSTSELLRDADAAMYQAKEQGRACHSVLDEAARARTSNRLQLGTELHRALDRNELRVCYQPVVDMATGDVLGAEGLLRWHNSARGVLAPGEFLDLANDIGLIAEFDSWILLSACVDTAQWCSQLGRRVGIWINLSARSLSDPRLADTVGQALEQSGLDAALLTLEITEGALMQDAAATVGTLTTLRDIGVQLAVDDFGTGYSSLAYLQQFPVHALKVDRSFVSRLDRAAAEADGSAAIVRAIVHLAAGLDLRTVAEGIETADQLAAVTELGCDLGQGFFLGRPASREDIAIAVPNGVLLPAAFATAEVL